MTSQSVFTSNPLLNHWIMLDVGNIRCRGNDLPLGFYAAERNSLGGDTMFVLSGA